MRDDRFDHRPNDADERDWSAELKDDENPRPDVQRLRRVMRRRSMAMRMELRQQDPERD